MESRENLLRKLQGKMKQLETEKRGRESIKEYDISGDNLMEAEKKVNALRQNLREMIPTVGIKDIDAVGEAYAEAFQHREQVRVLIQKQADALGEADWKIIRFETNIQILRNEFIESYVKQDG